MQPQSGGALKLTSDLGSSTLHPQDDGDLRITTDYGYVDVGPQNATFCHFSTDRNQFYFNKKIVVNGDISSYNDPLVLLTDYNDTTYPTKIVLSDASMSFYTNTTTEGMRFDSSDNLHVNGDVIAYSSTVSDARLKDDVQTIPNALSKIQALRGVSYTWNAGSRSGQHDIGLIAQEVEKVLPEIVRPKKMPLLDGNEYKTIDYEKIIAVLVESVKELSDKVDHLQKQVDNA
jgi:hypothetical protein